MADPFIVICSDIVIMWQILFFYKLPQDVYIPVSVGVFSKDKMVGNDNNLIAVPYLRIFTELLFENCKSTWPANIVRHQNIYIYPYIVARGDRSFPRVGSKYFFCNSHTHSVKPFKVAMVWF